MAVPKKIAVPNEVKVKIHHNILLLKTFTVPQLQAITGLNRQSIISVVRRMVDDGLVSRSGIEEARKDATGGRPATVYQLATDPEKQFQVLQRVRAFYLEAEKQPPKLARPESKHYFIASEKLEEAIRKGNSLSGHEKAGYLDLIKVQLEYARQEEEVGEEGTQLIAACLDILEAKAAEVLAGDLETAIKLLAEARKVCQQLGVNDLVTEINSHVYTIISCLQEKQWQCKIECRYEGVEQVPLDMRIIEIYFGDLPIVNSSAKQMSSIAAWARQEQISVLADEKVRQQLKAITDVIREKLTDELGRVPTSTIVGIEPMHGFSRQSLSPLALMYYPEQARYSAKIS